MGTDPMAVDVPFRLDVTRWRLWTNNIMRLSWLGMLTHSYAVWGGTNPACFNLITNLPGQFPVTKWMAPYTAILQQFFRIRAQP